VACDPEILMLPAHTSTAGAVVEAMNDSGLVVGESFDFDTGDPARVVVWRSLGPPTDVGIGGVVRADGSTVRGWAADVNDAGVVAAGRDVYSPRGRWRGSAALLWDEVNGTTRLPGLPRRRQAGAHAINEHGLVVGRASTLDGRSVPVYWRAGHVERLPLPPRAESGSAIDNNNRGLIVGHVEMDGKWRPWRWRVGGRNGPLDVDGLRSLPSVVAVDDHDRVVGRRPASFESNRIVLWRTPTARPRDILGTSGGVAAMDDSRYLAGAQGGFRGIADRAWVARRGDTDASSLPDPPLENPDLDWWENTYARTLARGVSAFAPQGGITVGGSAHPGEDEPVRAVLWTCAHTYLE
jgi:hypothetical protein